MSELSDKALEGGYLSEYDFKYLGTRAGREVYEQEIARIRMALDAKDKLLKDIFSDITKDNRLSPDTFDRLVGVVKNEL